MKRNIIYILALSIFACSAYSQNSSLWFGYYQEDAGNNPEDPGNGVVYLYIPGNGQFSGELIFSYQGCDGGIQRGRVSGEVTNSMINGNWSGTVDGVGVGGSYTGNLSSDGKSYSGTYRNSAGKKKIECEDLAYYVAARGTWQVYGSHSSSGMELTVEHEEGYNPYFEWTDFEDLEFFRFVVIDKECLEREQDLEKCMMWGGEYVFNGIEYGEDREELLDAKPLEKGRTYVIHVLAFNEDLNIVGSVSKEFQY